ncbi:MAG: hypothetical protein U0176_24245 [Bacteroidia bacterium]
MKVAERISLRRAAITEKVFAIEDEATLDMLLDIVESWGRASEPVPQEHLESISRGLADAKAGRVVSAEEMMKELDDL